MPKARIVALLANPNATTTAAEIADVQAAARSLNSDLHVVNASTESELEAAFAIMARYPAGAIIVGADPFFNGRRDQLVALASRFAIRQLIPFENLPLQAASPVMGQTSTADIG